MTITSAMIDIGGKPTVCNALTVSIHDVQADRVTVSHLNGNDPFTTITIDHEDRPTADYSSLFVVGTPEERAIELRRIADRLHAAADELLATTTQEA
jgi:hypothetical protein